MRRTAFASATAALVFLAGCNGSAEPSAPPTSEDALTTATTDPVATTEEPTEGDEAAVTTEAAATTQLPTADDGPPEMPQESMQRTPEGALAFAQHFVDVVNYTGPSPEPGIIADLSEDDCETCSNLEETVATSARNQEFLEGDGWEVREEATVLVFGEDQALVRVPLTERTVRIIDAEGNLVGETAGGTYDMALDLVWNDGWLIRTIQFER